jgi:hypothetical protein
LLGSGGIGGVGLVAENEIFDYAKSYLGDFGIIYRSVQARVAILIFIDGAEMGTARADLVLPGENRKSIPWKRLGAHFAENMPDEIDALLSNVTVNSASFDAEMAKMLDKDWMRKLAPVAVHTPSAEGEPATGAEQGDATPPGDDIERQERNATSPRPKRQAAERQRNGNDPSKPKLEIVPPQVEFVPEIEFDYETHPFGITWYPARNVILIAENFPPFVREIGRWCEKLPQHTRQLIEAAVRGAYQIEYAATIIDANVQGKFKLGAEQVEALKSDAALYAKVLGMQSLTERTETYIRTAAKNA